MVIRALLLCSVLLLPVSLCQALVQNGGFEAGNDPWQWAVNTDGDAGVRSNLQLYAQDGTTPDGVLLPHEGDKFGRLMPDGNNNFYRPQIVSVYQDNVQGWDGWWFEGVYSFHQLYPQTDPNDITSGDYMRISVVEKSVWDAYLGGGGYDGLLPDASTVWYQTYTADTCYGNTFQADWWQPWKTADLAAGTYTILFDAYRYGGGPGYSVAGFDTVSHTPEPSLGLLLLVGMIPVAIGCKRRRLS